MAHMYTHHHKGDNDPKFVTFVIEFIGTSQDRGGGLFLTSWPI